MKRRMLREKDILAKALEESGKKSLEAIAPLVQALDSEDISAKCKDVLISAEDAQWQELISYQEEVERLKADNIVDETGGL